MMATYRKFIFIALLITAGSVATGCATASTQTQQDEKEKAYNDLQARLAESERLNKRLDRKIGHLEQALAATQDKIEAQTIAAQYGQHQPDPVPESRFSNGFTQERSYAQARRRKNSAIPQRKERRIILSPNHYVPPSAAGVEFYSEEEPMPADASPETIIITQDDLEAFDRGAARAARREKRSESSRRVGGRVAQPDVTDERLPVTGGARNVSAPPAVAKRAVEPTQQPLPAIAATAPQKPARPNAMSLPPQPRVHDASLEVYEEGLNFYRNGDFQSSLDRFSQFLQRGPAPVYLDNALYWIGESYYGLNNMPKSIQYFKRVLKEAPDGNKVPNAMLKMAIAYRNLGNEKKSQSILKQVVQKFPASGAGQIAKRELEK